MSKQEILSWSSLATSTSVVIFYILIVFGWPDLIPDYSGLFVNIAFNAFWIGLIIEIIVQIQESKSKVQKDERDIMIEGKGHRNAYSVLVVTIAFILGQILLSGFLGGGNELYASFGESTMVFHLLFIALFMASVTKRVTMIYYYRKDA